MLESGKVEMLVTLDPTIEKKKSRAMNNDFQSNILSKNSYLIFYILSYILN